MKLIIAYTPSTYLKILMECPLVL